MTKLLTIITLTKNSEEYIAQCILSLNKALERCDRKKIEHVLIDANSKDNTKAIVKNLSPKTKIYSQKGDKGLYNAINYAIKEKVTTPYVTYLHSDDMIDEDYLNFMLKNLNISKTFRPIVYVGSVAFINENNKNLYVRRPPYYFSFIQKSTNLIFHPNAVYPAEIERKFPYSEKKFSRKADGHHIFDIMRVCKQMRVPKAVYKFRISKKSLTYSEGRNLKQDKTFFSRLYVHLFETNLLKRMILKIQGKSYWM